jgi:hypothetical protein
MHGKHDNFAWNPRTTFKTHAQVKTLCCTRNKGTGKGLSKVTKWMSNKEASLALLTLGRERVW